MTLPFDPTQYIAIEAHELTASSSMESPLHRMVKAMGFITENIPNTDETRKQMRVESILAFTFKAKMAGHDLVLVLSQSNKVHWKFDVKLKVVECSRYAENESAARQVIYDAFDSLFVTCYLAEQHGQVRRLLADIQEVQNKASTGAVQTAMTNMLHAMAEQP